MIHKNYDPNQEFDRVIELEKLWSVLDPKPGSVEEARESIKYWLEPDSEFARFYRPCTDEELYTRIAEELMQMLG